MRGTEELFGRANRWLAEHSPGGGDREAWEAAETVLGEANHIELGSAVNEILRAAEGDDKDARNIVASFHRLHPPQSLGNPERQRELVGLYLVLRDGGLWDTSADLGNPLRGEDLEQMLD